MRLKLFYQFEMLLTSKRWQIETFQEECIWKKNHSRFRYSATTN